MITPFDEQLAKRLEDQTDTAAADAAVRAYTASLYASSFWLADAGRFVGTVKSQRSGMLGTDEVIQLCVHDAGSTTIGPGPLASFDRTLLARARAAELTAEQRSEVLLRSKLSAAPLASQSAAEAAAGSATARNKTPPRQPPKQTDLQSRHGASDDGAALKAEADLWLHDAIDARWVDFVHPTHALGCLLRDDLSELCASLADERLVWAGDATPATVAQQLQQVIQDNPTANAALLARRGVLVWGDSAAETYRRMNALLGQLDALMSRHIEMPSVTDHRSEELTDARRRFGLSLRGAMIRAGRGHQLVAWRREPELQAILRNGEVLEAADHAWLPDQPDISASVPLVLNELLGLNPEALAKELDGALQQALRAGGAAPNTLLIPDLGLVVLADNAATAMQRANRWGLLLHAIAASQALGSFQPGSERPTSSLSRASKPLPLAGKIALVTSAGSGIGSATARAMLAAGAHVALCERDERVLEAVGEWPTQTYGKRTLLQLCDTADDASCERAVAGTCDAFGGIDILVSNAGASASGAIFGDSGHAALSSSLDANLLAHQRIARHVASAMLQQQSGGVLLFNAAKSAFHQGPGFGPYAVAKAALVSLMRQYAIDLGRFGIRSNAVNADRVRTNLISDGVLDSTPSAHDLSPSTYFRANLLRREATPKLVADAFVYLASADATTGCIITVDGGNPAAFPR